MRKNFLLLCVVLIVLALGCSQSISAQQNTDSTALILNHYSGRNWAAGEIPRADLERIVQAGVRAPSAGNRQPWHFTVVQNQNLARQLVSGNTDGNILIVVSASGDGKTNGVQILDCALAVQSIYLMAQALGYGSRIYTGPMDTLNNRFKTELGLPSGHNAVALVRVGKLQGTVDAVSAASARKRTEEVVTYK